MSSANGFYVLQPFWDARSHIIYLVYIYTSSLLKV